MKYFVATGSSMEQYPINAIETVTFPKSLFGCILTPIALATLPIKEGYEFILDNNVFTKKFSEHKYLHAIHRLMKYANTCIGIVIPDVVGNYLETRKLFEKYYPKIKDFSLPVFYVGQDGETEIPQECDAIFIGGSTQWKLSKEAENLIKLAQKKNKYVHVGRVNSGKRYKKFLELGVNSVDGTHFNFSPTQGYKDLIKWSNHDFSRRKKQ